MIDLQAIMDRAMAAHAAGRLAEAEKLYRQVLQASPNEPDPLHLLGVIAGQTGRSNAAIDLMRRAIAIKPAEPVYHGNLAFALDGASRLDEAIASFETAARLGNKDPGITNNHADALRKNGRLDEAVAMLLKLCADHPNFAEARNNLGLALATLDRIQEAIAEYRNAIRLNPRLAEAHNNLGNALLKSRLYAQAIAELEIALSCRPDYAGAMVNLGAALRAVNAHDRAIALYQKALQLQPDFFEALVNLGQSMCDIHRFDDAIATFKKAITLRPDDPAPHFHLSGVLLLTGNFQAGWKEYEWRLLKKDFPYLAETFPQERWTGQNPAGKRIYLHAEQGAGDLIQYSRLAADLTRCGAEVWLGSPSHLTRLLNTFRGVAKIVEHTPSHSVCDYHCYLLSLPLLLDLRLDAIPAKIPYLFADRGLSARWRTRLDSLPPGKKIGLTWAGNPQHSNDHNRSIALGEFRSLSQIPGVTLISLQKGAAAAPRPDGMPLHDFTSELNDYADTAALIDSLDLVISADTSVAHLAGALGKPVWTLLPFHPDFRWLLDRADTPWYPTMRLFRQPRAADWKSVLSSVSQVLRNMP